MFDFNKFTAMFARSILWGAIGILLGIIVNQLFSIVFTHYYSNYKMYRVFAHLFISAIIISFIHTLLESHIKLTDITYEAFFIVFFFGSQYSLFTDLDDLEYHILKKNKI